MERISDRFPSLAGRGTDSMTETMKKVLLSTVVTLLEMNTAMRAVEVDGRVVIKMTECDAFYLDAESLADPRGVKV